MAGETLNQLLHTGGVEGGHTGVTGLHRLEGDCSLFTSNFTDDYLVGTLAQRSP